MITATPILSDFPGDFGRLKERFSDTRVSLFPEGVRPADGQPNKQRKHAMSKKAAEHHKKAAEHATHAARHHTEAGKHHNAGQHEKAAHHAHTAHGHASHARHHAEEAARAHTEEHGKK